MNTFNVVLFHSELPLLGGFVLAFLLVTLLLAAIPAAKYGAVRPLVTAFALTTMLGLVGIAALAAECYHPFHVLMSDFEDLFPQTPACRWGYLGGLIGIFLPIIIPLLVVEGKIFNWMAKENI